MKEAFSETAVERNGAERLEPELRALWRAALAEHPELSSVEIVIPDASDDLGFTGGEFLLPEEGFPDPAIVIVPGGEERFEELKNKRPLAADIAAKMVGVPAERLTGAMLKRFIFLHELGHAQEYLARFQADPDIGPDVAPEAWLDRSRRELESLPVPSKDPNDLGLDLKADDDLSALFSGNPGLRPRLEALGIRTKRELLDAQEAAYRALPKEAYADAFAARLFKNAA